MNKCECMCVSMKKHVNGILAIKKEEKEPRATYSPPPPPPPPPPCVCNCVLEWSRWGSPVWARQREWPHLFQDQGIFESLPLSPHHLQTSTHTHTHTRIHTHTHTHTHMQHQKLRHKPCTITHIFSFKSGFNLQKSTQCSTIHTHKSVCAYIIMCGSMGVPCVGVGCHRKELQHIDHWVSCTIHSPDRTFQKRRLWKNIQNPFQIFKVCFKSWMYNTHRYTLFSGFIYPCSVVDTNCHVEWSQRKERWFYHNIHLYSRLLRHTHMWIN